MNATKPKQANGRLKRAAEFTLQGLNQLIWPTVCISCGESICESSQNLCQNCWQELLACAEGSYCRRCGRDSSVFAIVEGACPDCHGKQIYFDRIARAGLYADSLRKIILNFKKGRTEFLPLLGLLANSALQGGGFYDELEMFVPVPLHWTRRLVRGYNQSAVLAGSLNHPRAKISTDLVRMRRTRTQTLMASEASRAANVAGAFAVRRGHKFAGRSVCLVDDIKTSGATLNECARTLKEAGAARVFGLVLAVAGQDKS